jgi:hypothetical protein
MVRTPLKVRVNQGTRRAAPVMKPGPVFACGAGMGLLARTAVPRLPKALSMDTDASRTVMARKNGFTRL